MASSFNLMARAIRGLEWVVAAEIKGRLNADIVAISHREVHFSLAQIDRRLLEIRSADDVFLTCGKIEDLDHTRASLQRLTERISQLDLAATFNDLKRIRPVEYPNRFDVVGALSSAKGIITATRLKQRPRTPLPQNSLRDDNPPPTEPAPIYLGRVHVRSSDAYLGLRLLPIPLHRRHYRSSAYKGSLHPPVAAAMALLTGLRPDAVFLDPCCGSGTIGIEAAYLEPQLVYIGRRHQSVGGSANAGFGCPGQYSPLFVDSRCRPFTPWLSGCR